MLSVGICECEFYLRSTNKEGFIGYATAKDKKEYCVVFDNREFYFDKDIDILISKVINGKTLEEAWDDIEISFIDGLNDEEYMDYIYTPNFYLNEFVALNKVTNTLEVESLINKLKKSEYNGNILLYVGSKELSEFSNQDNEYTYYIFDTFNKGIYLLKKEANVSQIASHVNLSQPLVSHHLRLLKDLRILKSSKKGQCVYYSLNDDHIKEIVEIDTISHTFDFTDKAIKIFEKPTFPSLELANYLKDLKYQEVELCGLVSNICVLSNAIMVKSALPNANIVIDAFATDSFDKELQSKAFDVLEGLHIKVINR